MQDVEKTTEKVELSDIGDDIVDDFRKAKRPAHVPQEVWDNMWKAISEPEHHLGLPEAEVNGIPSIIWDSWEHADADDNALWDFCQRWESGLEYGDRYKDSIAWTRKQLKKFKGIVGRFADGMARASDLHEIVDNFEIKMKLQTARVNGKVEFIELRSYERAVDPERQKWADENDPHDVVDTRVSAFLFFLYSALYNLLVVGHMRLSVCAAKDCDELFIQVLHGRGRLYHSRACQAKEYRRRKKALV